MTQRLERYSSPIQRYKKNMARIIWNARSSMFSDYGKQLVKDTFKYFGKEWHDTLADEYPKLTAKYMTLEEDNKDSEMRYAAWRNMTEYLESEQEKRNWWLEIENVEDTLRHFYNWPNGDPDKKLEWLS